MAQPCENLEALLKRVRACTLCAAHLPLGPRPVVRARPQARLLIIGQAPGTKVHETGVPWNDPSGDRLRDWLGLDRDAFYDEDRIAIVPTGFCYPGRNPRGGDMPPRPECAPAWHGPILQHLKQLELTLLVGMHAQAYHLGARRQPTMTATVHAWRSYGPALLPTPHPSWRTTMWIRKNPWFETDLLPWLRDRVAQIMKSP